MMNLETVSNTLNHRGLNLTVKGLCAAAVIAMFLISGLVYHADWGGLLIFAAFFVFYVQLPGQLIFRALGFRAKHFSTVLSTGFFSGWAFMVLQYFLAELIHTNLLLYAVGPLCSLLYMISLRRRSSKGKGGGISFRPDRISTSACIFIVLCLLYAMLETQFLYLSPKVDEYIYMNSDTGFHIGLINALSHGYPLVSPWFSGLTFNYHIFTELLYSVPVRLFGLTSDVALLTCGPYMTTFAVTTSLYSLFREMTKKKERAGLYCLAIILSNIFVLRGLEKSIAFLFVFRNENVTGYGVSGAIVLVILLNYWYQSYSAGESSWKKLILVAGVLMLISGIKGPFGLTMLAALWGTLVIGLILRKVSLRTAAPMILLTLAFLAVYLTVLGSKGQGNSSGDSLFALAKIAEISFYKSWLIQLTKSMGLPLFARYGVLLASFAFFMLTAFFFPFVIGYIRELILVFTGRKEFDFVRVTVYAACLVGFIAMMFLNYHGRSQIYFGFATVFFAPLISYWFFEDMAENRGAVMKLIRGVFLVSLVFYAVTLGVHGVSFFNGAASAANPDNEADRYLSISQEEYQAMRWIDENTPRDSLLATDRYYSRSLEDYNVENRWDNRFFLYADYSNRGCYLAGSGYILPAARWPERKDRIEINSQLYDEDNEARGELARKLGVDYVVVSKRFDPPGDLSNRDYKSCFSNEDIEIYQVAR